MRLESKNYLRDIARAAELADEFLTGTSCHDYANLDRGDLPDDLEVHFGILPPGALEG